jgi:hypothetical protein
VGFEPTIAVLERAKTVRALDRAATAIGLAGQMRFPVPTVGHALRNCTCSETTTQQLGGKREKVAPVLSELSPTAVKS